MSNPSLQEALPMFLEWIPKIRSSATYKDNLDFQLKLNTAEGILQSMTSGLRVRETLRAFAQELREAKVDGDEGSVKINDRQHPFMHLRAGTLAGLLSSTWGIYDNIVYLCAQLLDCDRSSSSSLSAFIDSKHIKIPAPVLGSIRQRYGYPVAYSYQIRNSVIHRLPFLSDWNGRFTSHFVSDGYIVTAAGYQTLADECMKNYKIREGESTNFNFVSNADQCLLEVLDRLQLYTDGCVTEILRATLHPLNQTDLPTPPAGP